MGAPFQFRQTGTTISCKLIITIVKNVKIQFQIQISASFSFLIRMIRSLNTNVSISHLTVFQNGVRKLWQPDESNVVSALWILLVPAFVLFHVWWFYLNWRLNLTLFSLGLCRKCPFWYHKSLRHPATLAVRILRDVKLSEHDLVYRLEGVDRIVAVRSRYHVAPVDERTAAEVGIASVTLDWIKNTFHHFKTVSRFMNA